MNLFLNHSLFKKNLYQDATYLILILSIDKTKKKEKICRYVNYFIIFVAYFTQFIKITVYLCYHSMIKTMTKKINQKVLIAAIIVASSFSFLFVNSQKGFSINSKTTIPSELLRSEVREDAEKSKKLTVPGLSAIEKVISIVQKLVPGN
jgi:hypothetical protein